MEGSDFAAEAAAATADFIARSRAAREEVPKEVAASRERVRELLEEGGRVLCTVRARESGRHVTVLLVAKKRGADRRYVSRAKIAGRVGIRDASTVFAEDPDREWPDCHLGALYLDTGEWKDSRGAEPTRAWAARAVLRWALGSFDLADQAEVFVATTCCFCGKRLTDPESVERGVGPECFRKRTRSKAAERTHALRQAA